MRSELCIFYCTLMILSVNVHRYSRKAENKISPKIGPTVCTLQFFFCLHQMDERMQHISVVSQIHQWPVTAPKTRCAFCWHCVYLRVFCQLGKRGLQFGNFVWRVHVFLIHDRLLLCSLCPITFLLITIVRMKWTSSAYFRLRLCVNACVGLFFLAYFCCD